MSDHSIRITRNRNGFEVSVTDPEIVKQNRNNSGSREVSEWKSPHTEYQFDTSKQTLAFVEKAFDKALPDPAEEYSRSFDEAAKEAKKS